MVTLCTLELAEPLKKVFIHISYRLNLHTQYGEMENVLMHNSSAYSASKAGNHIDSVY